MENKTNREPWYAVRCLFTHPNRAKSGDGTLYEERITLWKCASDEEAYLKAENEAKEYEKEDCIFIKATDCFHLFDESIGEGTELWSVMRGSFLTPEIYEETFCNTSRDRKYDVSLNERNNT